VFKRFNGGETLQKNEILYLSRKDVEEVGLDAGEVVKIVEEAFREKGLGRVEMPPKPGVHPGKDAMMHAMLAYIPNMKAVGIKWIAGFPENFKLGLPYISGLIILNDPKTGFPISVMDCTWITAKRTGAATAVAAKYLAREDSKVFGVIGCGVQGRSNLEAILTVFDIEEVRAYDINRAKLERYVEDMTGKYGVKVVPAESPRGAVEGCDIVVTATPIRKQPLAVIEASWFKDGGFACPLDFDTYWKPEAMYSMDKFCTDDKNQLIYYRSIGYFKEIPEVYADLGEIVTGAKPGRENEKERIMSMNLGLAIEDVATASVIYERAKRKGIGTWLPL